MENQYCSQAGVSHTKLPMVLQGRAQNGKWMFECPQCHEIKYMGGDSISVKINKDGKPIVKTVEKDATDIFGMIRDARKWLDNLERAVKSSNPNAIETAASQLDNTIFHIKDEIGNFLRDE